MMKVDKFLTQIRKAVNSKTLYVMGGWGFPLTSSNKDRTQSQPYNRRPERKSKIYAAASDVFGFDCVGLAKAVLWGWDAKADQKNGGAVYGSNGVPDWDAKVMMFSGCKDPTTDFSHIDPGEFLWLDGHCGVYLGDGLAAESTPIWKDGVQITAVANLGSKTGYNSRRWTYHGHLKYVDYSGAVPSKYPPVPFDIRALKKLDVRKEPYSDTPIVGSVPTKGIRTITELGGSSGDYGKIDEGWIYLNQNQVRIFADQTIKGYTVGHTYTVVCKEPLNIRTGSSTSSKIIGEMHNGDKVTMMSGNYLGGRMWLHCSQGWVCAFEGNDVYIK